MKTNRYSVRAENSVGTWAVEKTASPFRAAAKFSKRRRLRENRNIFVRNDAGVVRVYRVGKHPRSVVATGLLR